LPDINYYDTISATGSRLLSPVRLDPFSNAHKRRAQHQLEDELSPGGSDIQHQHTRQELVFTGVGDISQRRIRLRNRGATLGAASDSRDRLHRLFSPPPTLEQPDTVTGTATVGLPSSASLAAPEPDDRHKRLGSPFELEANKRSDRRKSPRHIPSLSDPFVSVSNPFASSSSSQSIGERLATFSALQNYNPNNHGFFWTNRARGSASDCFSLFPGPALWQLCNVYDDSSRIVHLRARLYIQLNDKQRHVSVHPRGGFNVITNEIMRKCSFSALHVLS
jgi:hypothetical protein